MKIRNSFFCVFVLFFNLCFSQVIPEKTPLNEFLKSTETRFDVKFSYAPEDVIDIKITIPRSDFNL